MSTCYVSFHGILTPLFIDILVTLDRDLMSRRLGVSLVQFNSILLCRMYWSFKVDPSQYVRADQDQAFIKNPSQVYLAKDFLSRLITVLSKDIHAYAEELTDIYQGLIVTVRETVAPPKFVCLCICVSPFTAYILVTIDRIMVKLGGCFVNWCHQNSLKIV